MKKIRNCFTKEERRMKFNYRDFIEGEWWKKQKLDWYSRHKKRCAVCKSENNIHLHQVKLDFHKNNKKWLEGNGR